MNVEMPDPAPLDMPPGNAEALTEVVQDVAGAAFHLNVLAGSLTGPAATAPGWLGDDARAAVDQVGVAATLAQQAADAVQAAMHRLSAHAECLHDARRQVAALEREQEEDFRAAWVRLSHVENPVLAVQTGAPAWVGPIDDLRTSEAARLRRHAGILDDVADDAAATARVLADSCAAIGGRGAPGDAARVLAHFAAQLPGWGDRELALRGRALAEAFVEQWLSPQEHDALARDAAALAGSEAFAQAFLLGIGEDGLRTMLVLLGDGDFGATSPLPGLLARVLASAGSGGPVGAIVDAPYVDAFDPDDDPDRIVLGMAVVLAAAATGRSGRLPPAVVESWGRQIILRERVQGAPAMERVNPMMVTNPEVDAVPLVVDLLGRGPSGEEAAGLLADRDVWRVLLGRTWDDGGAADLARLVSLAGSEAGPDGGTALRAGLEALGTGLDEGDPKDWAVERETADAVARPLAEGLSAHWAVPAGILAAGADGETRESNADRLRGLGYLTIDPAAAAAVTDAVTSWVAHQPPGITATVSTRDLAVVAVPAAYLAVQEYGQRLSHALLAVELEAAAEDRELQWDATVGLVSQFVGGRLNPLVGVLESVAARLCDADGAWDIEPDRGAVFGREDAVSAARAQSLSSAPADIAALSAQARAAFDGTAGALGRLHPPTPPSEAELWVDVVLDNAGGVGEVRADEARRTLRKLFD